MENIERHKVEYENVDNVKLTRYQKNLVIQIVKGHVEDKRYYFHWAKVHVNRYFVALSFYYNPINAKENPYVTESKNIWIGRKGGIRKATTRSGVGKEFNIQKIAHYYFKASDL